MLGLLVRPYCSHACLGTTTWAQACMGQMWPACIRPSLRAISPLVCSKPGPLNELTCACRLRHLRLPLWALRIGLATRPVSRLFPITSMLSLHQKSAETKSSSNEFMTRTLIKRSLVTEVMTMSPNHMGGKQFSASTNPSESLKLDCSREKRLYRRRQK